MYFKSESITKNMKNNGKVVVEGFEAFRRGTFGNGGQNIYVSKAGVLQRIHQTDITRNGYIDLIYCNSQNHEELVPIEVYPDPIGNPNNKRELYVGGASDVVIADFTGDGTESMAWSCVWDGVTKQNRAPIYFGSNEGPSNRYVTYLPANLSTTVAAGDFLGVNKIALAFYSCNKIKIFYQDNLGFNPAEFEEVDIKDVIKLSSYRFKGSKFTSLLLLKEDGSVSALTGNQEGFANAVEEVLIPVDPTYRKVEFSWSNYNQFVKPPAPKMTILTINGIDYLPVFRKEALYLYNCSEKKFDSPEITFNVKNSLAIAVGDIFNRGQVDAVIAARDVKDNKEFSYLYLGCDGKFDDNSFIPIPTYQANDVTLGRFSKGKGLDIVICQSHTLESYDSKVLLFSTSLCDKISLPQPKTLFSHDASRVITIKDTQNRDYLVIGHARSGSYIGNPDNYVYLGSPTGYIPNNRLDIPGWGSVDVVCCDLNDNGKVDLVFANAAELSPWKDPGSYVYYQKEDGSFGRNPQTLRTYRAHGVVCGDINHNGYLDLVFVGFDNLEIKIFYGSENGYSEENSQIIYMKDKSGKEYRQPRFIAMADINGDGYLDLIITQITGEESFVLWGGPDGFDFERKQLFRVHHACNCKVADLDGDGYPELIFGGHTQTLGKPLDSFLYIYWGGPQGFSESRKTLLPSNAINSITVADFNNDGKLDIFIASYENGMERDIPSYIYWNTPTGFHPDKRTLLSTHAVSGSMAADFNGDGFIDLAVANHKYFEQHIGVSTVWYNSSNGFDEKNTQNLPTLGPHGMGNVDIGNILDRSFDEFYDSEVFEIPENSGISKVNVDAIIPLKCDVQVMFKCADTKDELKNKPWSGPIGENSRFSIDSSVDKYIYQGKYMQFRLSLYAYNALNTPRVKSVSISFEQL